MRIPSGKTDQYIYFKALDSSDLITPKTGLSSFTVYRDRNHGGAAAYTTPTVVEVDSANMPGVYALLIDEDTTIASGSDNEEYVVHVTCSGMAPVTRAIELYRRDTTSGKTLAVDNSGRVDLGLWVGVAPNALQSGRVDSYIGAVASGVIAAASFAANALDAVWSTATRVLTAGTNIVLAKGTGVTGFNDLDASGVRAAVGLASANLDTQLATIAAYIDTEVGTIVTQTTASAIRAALGLASANLDTQLDAIPTNTDLATALASADDATLAAIAALNNLSQADIRTAVGLGSANLDTQLGALSHLDVDVSTRLASASYTAPDNADILLIKAKTDNLPSDPADASDIAAAFAALNDITAQEVWDALTSALTTSGSIGKRLVDNVDAAVSTRLASASYTAPDNADILAIKAKTDNLPADPASESAVETAISGIVVDNAAIAAAVMAYETETGLTVLGCLRGFTAIMLNRWSKTGSVQTWRDFTDSKDRVSATIATNSRSAPTLDLS